MQKRARGRVSALAVAMPIVVCVVIAAFTDTIAMRAGFTAGVSVAISGVIGLLWLTFLVSRLVEQARPRCADDLHVARIEEDERGR